jgi:2-polyprenyl-3-methyl-5-hydroxy-6-metoxy-1,4-benzoquinol methylase
LHKENGILRVRPLPFADELREFYETKYFQQPHGNFAPAYEDDEIEFFNFRDRIFQKAASNALGRDNLSGLTLLDIGCGEGFSLRYFDRLGLKVHGSDFSVAGIERHNPELLRRIPFCQSDIAGGLPFSGQLFDLILLNGVLEHVREPLDLLSAVKSYCHDRSLIFVSVPNEYSPLQMEYLAGAPLESAPWFAPPEHLSYFCPDSLRDILSASGFDMIYIGAGYPIEQFLLRPETDYYRNPSFGKIAHALRKKFAKSISRDMNQALQVCASFASASIGRDLMVLGRPK